MAKPNFFDTDETIKSVGAWTWKDSLLWRKIVKTADDVCWAWTGSTGPHANLFGARKNNRPQMSQVPRFIWMSVHNEDVEHLEIRHTCGNRFCCNPNHLTTVPNHMLYRRDGTNRTDLPTAKLNKPIKQAQTKPVEKKWWQL